MFGQQKATQTLNMENYNLPPYDLGCSPLLSVVPSFRCLRITIPKQRGWSRRLLWRSLLYDCRRLVSGCCFIGGCHRVPRCVRRRSLPARTAAATTSTARPSRMDLPSNDDRWCVWLQNSCHSLSVRSFSSFNSCQPVDQSPF